MRTEEILQRIKNLATGKKTEEQVFSLSGGNLPDWRETSKHNDYQIENYGEESPVGNKADSGSASLWRLPEYDPNRPVEEYVTAPGIIADLTDVEFGEIEYPSKYWVQKAFESFEFGQKEMVDHPDHYNRHPAGVEVIDIIEELSFNVGNAIKYLMRAPHKGEEIRDYEKAVWYIQREIERKRLRNDENA